MPEPRQSPDDLGAAVNVHRVDEQRRPQLLERSAWADGVAERAQRLLEIERWRAHALHDHPEMIDAKQVATPERAGALGHLDLAHASCPCGRDERADTRAREEHGLNPALLERTQYADMGEPLEAAAAED
jgi:hypothetical protein